VAISCSAIRSSVVLRVLSSARSKRFSTLPVEGPRAVCKPSTRSQRFRQCSDRLRKGSSRGIESLLARNCMRHDGRHCSFRRCLIRKMDLFRPIHVEHSQWDHFAAGRTPSHKHQARFSSSDVIAGTHAEVLEPIQSWSSLSMINLSRSAMISIAQRVSLGGTYCGRSLFDGSPPPTHQVSTRAP